MCNIRVDIILSLCTFHFATVLLLIIKRDKLYFELSGKFFIMNTGNAMEQLIRIWNTPEENYLSAYSMNAIQSIPLSPHAMYASYDALNIRKYAKRIKNSLAFVLHLLENIFLPLYFQSNYKTLFPNFLYNES